MLKFCCLFLLLIAVSYGQNGGDSQTPSNGNQNANQNVNNVSNQNSNVNQLQSDAGGSGVPAPEASDSSASGTDDCQEGNCGSGYNGNDHYNDNGHYKEGGYRDGYKGYGEGYGYGPREGYGYGPGEGYGYGPGDGYGPGYGNDYYDYGYNNGYYDGNSNNNNDNNNNQNNNLTQVGNLGSAAGAGGNGNGGDENGILTGGEYRGDRIVRPCPKLDLYCIRGYFARYAKCKPSHRFVPDPYYRAQANFFYPAYNLTTAQTGVRYRRLNGRVEEFYVNRETDLVVLAIRFRNLRINSTLDYYRYHRVGREPAITKSRSWGFFPSITVTTVFRGRDHLRFRESESTTFLDALPSLYIDPSAGRHPDPIVQRSFTAYILNIRTTTLEAQLTDAPFYAGTFIQHRICDFGLKLL